MGSPSGEAGAFALGGKGVRVSRRDVLAVAGLGLVAGVPRMAAAKPDGQLNWGIHTTLAPIAIASSTMAGASRAGRNTSTMSTGSGMSRSDA